MLLSKIAESVHGRLIGHDTEITSIEYDSRKACAGSLFCCMVGAVLDGHDFAKSAVERCASALLVQRELPLDAPQIVVENSRKAMAEAASEFYGHPEREMTMVGVTGTNGKTTTTYMVKSIAETAGKKVGIIGTIKNMIGNESIPTERTTPESVDLFALLRKMADAGVDIVAMEVSSHALEQYRVYGIEFDAACFTNLTQDHLDYHKTFDNYLAAKKILFQQTKRMVINGDDPYSSRIMAGINVPAFIFGLKDGADIQASGIDISTSGVRFDLKTPFGNCKINIQIPGLFSVFNAMGSAGLALSVGFPLETVKKGLECMTGVSGRLEPVTSDKKVPYSVFIDYAHTPDALENVLNTIHEFSRGRIICVFGCGGNRDRAKRPIMGKISGDLADLTVITSDNPRNEDPMEIIETIEEGVKRTGSEYVIIENRRDAIRYAMQNAKQDDIILIAGKGHEDYQEIKGVKHHFYDKEVVEEYLGEI